MHEQISVDNILYSELNKKNIIYSMSQLEQVSRVKQELKNNLKIFCGKFNVWYTLIVCTFLCIQICTFLYSVEEGF
jgi:hypothetical protein